MNDALYKGKTPAEPKGWPESYYDAEDAAIRNQMLKEHCESDGNAEDQVRRKLFDKRYSLKENQYMDHYVAFIYKLRMLAEESIGPLRKKKVEKQVEEILCFLCSACANAEGTAETDLCFLELCHAVRVYIGICKRDKQYCSVILGQGRKKDSSIVLKLVQDFENMAVKLPGKLELEYEDRNRMKYLQKAFAEAFREEEPEEGKWYRYLLQMDEA